MHPSEIKPSLQKKLAKLAKRDKILYEAIIKKILGVKQTQDVVRYKNLRYDMKSSKRIHLGSFVLVFSYQESNDLISFEDFDHHDNIYKKQN